MNNWKHADLVISFSILASVRFSRNILPKEIYNILNFSCIERAGLFCDGTQQYAYREMKMTKI